MLGVLFLARIIWRTDEIKFVCPSEEFLLLKNGTRTTIVGNFSSVTNYQILVGLMIFDEKREERKKITRKRRQTDVTVFVHPSLEEYESKIKMDESCLLNMLPPEILSVWGRTDEIYHWRFLFQSDTTDGRNDVRRPGFIRRLIARSFFSQGKMDGRKVSRPSAHCRHFF